MSFLQINPGDGHIALDHIQGGVTEKALELQGIATVS